MAAIGVAFPIIMIITAFSALIGMGGAPIAAIKMGVEGAALTVAAMTIMSSIMQIVWMPLLGLTQGAQPIIIIIIYEVGDMYENSSS